MNNSKMDPLISVVMSVFNCEKYLSFAIESILSQIYKNFEFIVINDKSTDGTLEIARKFAAQDRRICLIENSENMGLAQSLNKGIDLAKGKYIARMDADDISLPQRFSKQVEFLEKNPSIWVLGGNIKHIDNQGKILRERIFPQNPNNLRWNLLFGDLTISHPAAMIRKSMFYSIGKYKEINTSQDLELWCRLFFENPFPINNLSETILYYRWHEKNISNEKKTLQNINSNTIHAELLEKFLQQPISCEVITAYRSLSYEYPLDKIRSYICIWVKAFNKFISFYHINKNNRNEIYRKLLFRINCYISHNPINYFSHTRLCIWREYFLLKEIGISGVLRLFGLKFSLIVNLAINNYRNHQTNHDPS